jgi:hypothetical protein
MGLLERLPPRASRTKTYQRRSWSHRGVSDNAALNKKTARRRSPRWRKQIERAAGNMSSGPPGSKLIAYELPGPGLHRLAPASRGRESKMLFHQRNKKVVAVRTQDRPVPAGCNFAYLGGLSSLSNQSEASDFSGSTLT